jgi:hypothetical protein
VIIRNSRAGDALDGIAVQTTETTGGEFSRIPTALSGTTMATSLRADATGHPFLLAGSRIGPLLTAVMA